LQSPFCIAKSGTNVMEFALLGTPSIVFYKTNFLTYCIIKLLAYTKFATILNFTANKAILPEFLQNNATSFKISLQAKIWLQNSEILSQTKQLMQKELEKFKTNINMPQTICNELNL
jgi:lipid-A-disaccharide synthase